MFAYANLALTLSPFPFAFRPQSQQPRELPRVLVLYDLDIELPDARQAVRTHFDRYAHIQDERVVSMLVAKGYMDLEETLLQHKQRSHLQRTLSGYIDLEGARRKSVTQQSSIDDQFARA
jgi:hypothetical protein